MSGQDGRRERVLWGATVVVASFILTHTIGYVNGYVEADSFIWWGVIVAGIGINILFTVEYLTQKTAAKKLSFNVPRVKRDNK